jgi:hypothetical protein
MRARFAAALALALAGAITNACGGIISPSQNTVETFSGTIQPAGNSGHPFSSKTGEIQVKLTALSPVSSTFVGMSWTLAAGDGSCMGNNFGGSLFQTVAQLNVQAISTQIISGRYCLILYDYIGFTAAENYTVTVSHP